MRVRDLQELASDCDGELRGATPGLAVRRICTDTRSLAAGDLFVCLRGPHHDGHRFAREAAGLGAAAVLGEAAALAATALPCPRILVPDARRALARLAAAHRRRFSLPVVAVAGSNGKTTTKNLLAAVLGTRFRVHASAASFNNDIGVPLTLLGLDPAHEVAVVEVGTNHPGELAPLLDLARPTHGVLTRLGREHLEHFGGLDGVATEEGELAAALPPGSVLVVAGDSPGIDSVMTRTQAHVVLAGSGQGHDWQCVSTRVSRTGTHFEVRAPREALGGTYRVPLLGRHQAENALLALALGASLGLDRTALLAGLAGVRPAPHRLQLTEAGGRAVLDDAYNANPDSMLAALATLAALDCPGRRVAVLGDMAELGSHAEAAHREIGRAAATFGVQHLFGVGRWASVMLAGAAEAGLAGGEGFSDATAAADAVPERIGPGDLVLVKASRATGLEVVAAAILRAAGQGAARSVAALPE